MQPHRTTTIHMIVSGGQTGVDRAALDVAIEFSIPHGGWCPRGRRAEDGTIPPEYQLQETDSPKYQVRTQRNVEDSDGTLILYREGLTGGTELTRKFAMRYDRPYIAIDLETEQDVTEAHDWLVTENIQKLNVAGPRESTSPGIAKQAREFLRKLI